MVSVRRADLRHVLDIMRGASPKLDVLERLDAVLEDEDFDVSEHTWRLVCESTGVTSSQGQVDGPADFILDVLAAVLVNGTVRQIELVRLGGGWKAPLREVDEDDDPD